METILFSITYLTLLSALGLMSYALVVFIDFCFNEGNIFDWYYSLLLNKVKPSYPKLAKMLGLCPVCFGFWVGIGFYLVSWKYLGVHPIGFIYFTAVSQYALLKRFVFTDNN